MKKLFFVFFLFLIFIAGCWDRRELDEVAFVSVAGFERAPEGKVKFTAHIILPRKLLSTSSGGGGGGSGEGKESPALLATAEGETAVEAARNLIKQLGRKVYWDHNRVLIFEEEMAKEGLLPVLDILARTPEVRLRNLVVVAKGVKLEELLSPKGERLDPNFAKTFENALKWRQASGKIKDVDLKELLEKVASEGKDPVATTVTLKEGKFLFEGIAAFKDDKLSGWLDDYETQGFLYVVGKKPGGIVSISTPEGEKAAVEITNTKAKIIPEISGEEVTFRLELKVEGNFREAQGVTDPTSPETWAFLEEETAEKVKAQVEAAVKRAQALGADIFGFGQALHAKSPVKWRELKENWRDTYPQLKVEVSVRASLRRLGILRAPVSPQPAAPCLLPIPEGPVSSRKAL